MNKLQTQTYSLLKYSRTAGRVLSFSLLEAASVYPLAVVLSAFVVQQLPPPLLLLAAWLAHAGGVWMGSVQSGGGGGRLRFAAPVLIAAALLLPAAAAGLRLSAGLAALALLVMAARGLIAGRKQRLKTVPLRLPLIGLGAAFIVYVAAGRVAPLQPHRISLYLTAVLVLFMLLLRWNEERVRYASHADAADRSLFRRIIAANRSLTWLILAVIAVLSSWKGLGSLFLLLRDSLRSLLLLLQGDGRPQEPAPMPEQQQMPDLGGMADGTGQQPMWLQVAGYVFLALLGLLAALLLGYLLYKLIRRWLPERIRRLLRGIAYRFGLLRSIRRLPEEHTDFVDEIEKMERATSRPRRFHRPLQGRADPSAAADPRQAYASLIRRAVKKGYGFQASRTPLENGTSISSSHGPGAWTDLPPEQVKQVISRYNAARYGREGQGD